MSNYQNLKPNTPEFELELAEILAEICRHLLRQRRKNCPTDLESEQSSLKRTFDKFHD